MVTIPIPNNFPRNLIHQTLARLESICQEHFKDNHQRLYEWMFKIIWDDATQEFHWDLLENMLDRYIGKWETLLAFKSQRQLLDKVPIFPLVIVDCNTHVHVFNGYKL